MRVKGPSKRLFDSSFYQNFLPSFFSFWGERRRRRNLFYTQTEENVGKVWKKERRGGGGRACYIVYDQIAWLNTRHEQFFFPPLNSSGSPGPSFFFPCGFLGYSFFFWRSLTWRIFPFSNEITLETGVWHYTAERWRIDGRPSTCRVSCLLASDHHLISWRQMLRLLDSVLARASCPSKSRLCGRWLSCPTPVRIHWLLGQWITNQIEREREFLLFSLVPYAVPTWPLDLSS